MSRNQRNSINKTFSINNRNSNIIHKNKNLIILVYKSLKKELNKASSKYSNKYFSKPISKFLKITLCNSNRFYCYCHNRNTLSI